MDIPHRKVNIKSNDTVQDTPEKKKTDLPKVNIPTIRFDKTIESVQREDIEELARKEIQSYSITPREIVRTYKVFNSDNKDQLSTDLNDSITQLKELVRALEDATSQLGQASPLLHKIHHPNLTAKDDKPLIIPKHVNLNDLIKQEIVESKSHIEKLNVFYNKLSVDEAYNKFYFIETIQDGIKRYGVDVLGHIDLVKLHQDKVKNNKPSNPPPSSTQYVTDVILDIMEVLLIKTALCELTAEKGVVLVDIFARSNGEYKPQKCLQHLPEIHSVVLYKEGNKVLLLDPTNSDLSSHVFIGANALLWQSSDKQYLPIVAHKLKIYDTPNDPVTGPSTWRDCIDIAIKLACTIKYLEYPEIPDDIKLLNNWLPVNQITNLSVNNVALPKSFKDVPTRVIQTSDNVLRQKIFDLVKQHHYLTSFCGEEKFVQANKLKKEEIKTLQREFTELFDTYADAEDVVQKLIELNKGVLQTLGIFQEDNTNPISELECIGDGE